MRSALYYPHTQIQSEHLLKTSLLMWDRLEFIVPDPNYKPWYSNPSFERAVELIGIQRYPSAEDRRLAHDQIEDLATRPLPDPFFYRNEKIEQYEIYPQKLMPETWKILTELKLAGQPLANADYPLSSTAGLSVMSILADCCAGETRARITDRGVAYATLTNLMVEKNATNQSTLYDRVVPITLRIIDATQIPLDRLIRFREREDKESGNSLRDLRHRYLDRIETHVKLLQEAKSKADWAELDRIFELSMTDDLRQLNQEIRGSKTEAFISKELIVSAIAAGASVWGALHGLPFEVPAAWTALGAPVTVGGLFSTRLKYAAARKAIMQKHPMAYLYELAN